MPQTVINDTYQQVTNSIAKFGIIQDSFAELLVLCHTANYNIHKGIIERESEMLLRVIPGLSTKLLVSIHIGNYLFQNFIDISELCAEFLVNLIDQFGKRSLFFFGLWFTRMYFIRQRVTLLQCNRALKDFLYSVILQGHFIIEEHWPAAFAFWQLLQQEFCVSMEFMEISIIKTDNIS